MVASPLVVSPLVVALPARKHARSGWGFFPSSLQTIFAPLRASWASHFVVLEVSSYGSRRRDLFQDVGPSCGRRGPRILFSTPTTRRRHSVVAVSRVYKNAGTTTLLC